jgi:hypothetical protein
MIDTLVVCLITINADTHVVHRFVCRVRTFIVRIVHRICVGGQGVGLVKLARTRR